MTIGEKVQAFLVSRNISQEAFGNLVGWTKSSVNELKEGKKDRSVLRMHNLCEQMGCSLDYLVDTSKDWPPPDSKQNLRLLTNEQVKILSYAEDLGHDVAMSRLLNIPGERVSLDAPRSSSPPVGRKVRGV